MTQDSQTWLVHASQSPQIGSMFRTANSSKAEKSAADVAIPSNRVNVPDNMPTAENAILYCRNPLKSGQCSGLLDGADKSSIDDHSRNPLKSGQCSGQQTQQSATLKLQWSQSPQIGSMFRTQRADCDETGRDHVAIPSNRVNVPDSG